MTRYAARGGPSGASTVIEPDEDKWTGPIWPPVRRGIIYRKRGVVGGWLDDGHAA